MPGALAPVYHTCATARRTLVNLPALHHLREGSFPQRRTPCSPCPRLHVPFASASGPGSGRDDEDRSSTTASTSGRAGGETILTLPTILTLARVAAIPALIAVWYWGSVYSAATCTAVFAVASLTDWLDGYLARKLGAYSAFGAFLDPVADKLMVAAVLILLCTQPIPAGPLAGNAWLIPVMTLAIIGREITMSALREWAATAGPEARQAVAVNSWGKWKTAAQMASLTLLLLCKDGGEGTLVQVAATTGPALLVVASWLTVHSLAIYMRGLWKHFAKPIGSGKPT